MAASSQLVGHTLGHYRIIEQIGAGGMGVVYRARDERLERDVALKVLPVGTLADESARRRFRKEALTLSKLSHPNIATVHDFDSQDGIDFLVTEYISGVTLDAKLAGSALPEKEVIRLGIQLSEGLNAAHQQDIVHRDLKPANLRLTPDGRLKILDFGLAQLMPHASEIGMTATLTQSQDVTGTLPYMAPEQLRGGVADARSDIWAAGAVLYEMATAHRPFEEKLPSALAADIIHKTPLPPRKVRSGLSRKLEAIILKCLEKERDKRYASAHELQSDLERLSTGVTPLAAWQRRWLVIATSAIVVVLLAVGAFFYLHRSPKLTEKDTIVLADFTNTTGETVLDDTLKQALSVQLGQSPFLNILSDKKLGESLKLMGRSANERLTPDVARDLCLRAGSKVYLSSSIAKLGHEYVLGVNAINCQTGDSLAREQVTADSQEHVLKALDEAASKLRKELGESLATIQKFGTPLGQATTSSLEALKAYSLGLKVVNEKGDAEAIPLFKRAVELDPNFAMAYASLGTSYYNLGRASLSIENTKKAYELRDRVSEHEKLVISADHAGIVTGDLLQEIQAYELWEQTYPRDFAPHTNLGADYASLGQYGKAVEEARRSLALEPNNAIPYFNLAQSFLALNHFDDARIAFNQAVALKLDAWALHIGFYELAFLQGDPLQMQKEIDWARGKPDAESWMDSLQADTAAYFGRLQKARQLSQLATESAQRNGSKDNAALWMVSSALREAELGDRARARLEAQAALDLVRSKDVELAAALALARAEDVAHGQALAQELSATYPWNTLLNSYWLPAIRAAIEIDRGRPARALELLQAAAPYEEGSAPPFPQGTMYPVYVRGQAYLVTRQGNEAAQEFQRILEHRGVVQNFPLGALAHLGLARAYALQGNRAKARIAYQDFLALWKDADPDIPILKQAKAEYAKLQ
jgi:serine/threonine protein kinase/Flp pilus assembly protein TadD